MSTWILTAPRQKSETRPGDAVVPAAADRHDQVAADHRLVRVGRPVHAHHPEVERMGLVDGALAEQRGDQRGAQLLGERGDGLARIREHGSVPDVEQRPARLAQQPSGLGDALGVAAQGDLIAGQIDLVGEGSRAGALADVLRHVDQHRTRPAGGRHVEGLAHDARDVVRALHQVGVLHDRIRDPGDVRLLEGVLAQHRQDLLAADHDHRRGVHQRREQAGHGVGRSRAGGDQHDAGPPGRARVSVRHVGRALLVAHQDQLDRGVDQRVEDRHRRAAGEAEDVLHALALEALDQLLAPGRHPLLALFGRLVLVVRHA